MAENNLSGIYTLVDLMRMKAPGDGGLLFVADTLARSNPIVREAPMMEANQALTHIGSRDSQLPTVQKRAINDGVPRSAHREIPVTAPMSLFETWSRVDEESLRLMGGNAPEFRMRKDKKFIEAMSQSVADEIFYGSVADDVLGFNGLATQFNSSTVYPNGDSTWYYNVQKAGGSGSDTTSIWAVEWGPEKAHLIYPKNTVGGVEVVDLGKQVTAGVTAGTEFITYNTQIKWRSGLFIADERCVQRIANIESTGTSNIFDDDDLLTAINRLPSMGEDPMTRIYVNRTVRTQIDIRVKDKNNMYYREVTDAFGKPTTFFRGVPIQICDAITNTETAIS